VGRLFNPQPSAEGFQAGAFWSYKPELRAEGRDWPLNGETMIGLTRLQNIQDCVTDILRNNVPGDFIETDVWRGGACIFMRVMLKEYGDKQRTVWVADSLEGLPSQMNVAVLIRQIALLRLDGDIYSSTMDSLESLYGRLSCGGYVSIDDHGAVPACKRAVDEFRVLSGINATMRKVDGSGIFLAKN
jgi:O-methyltransferase